MKTGLASIWQYYPKKIVTIAELADNISLPELTQNKLEISQILTKIELSKFGFGFYDI